MSKDLRGDFRPELRDGFQIDRSKQPSLLQRFRRIPRLSEWIATSLAVAAAFLELCRHVSRQMSELEFLDTGIVLLAFVGLLLFVFIEFESAFRLNRKIEAQIEKLQKVREERDRERNLRATAEENLAAEVKKRKAISKVFTGLNDYREAMQSTLLAVIANGPVAESERAKAQADIKKTLEDYLGNVGDAAVDVLTLEKRPPSDLNLNFKILEKYQDSPDTRYRVFARSRNPDKNRVLDEDRRKEPCRLNDNAIYGGIIMQRGGTDYQCAPDVKKLLEDRCLPEPHPNSSRFYGSALAVAIQGPSQSALDGLKLPDSKCIEKFGEDGVLFGVVCVDCKEKGVFDEDWDLTIMRQIAGEAFDAIRLYYLASAICGPSPPVRLAYSTAE